MKRMSQQAVVCFLFCAGFYLLSAGDAMALSITDLFVTPDFSCVGGSPVGRINTTANCEMIYDYEQVLQEGRIFGYFLCRYEQILNDLLSMTYCGVVDYLKPAIMAGMTLLIALAGASFLMGVTTFNAKELMTLAFKYSLVLAFATQAEYMIGLGYNLFMTGSKEGIVYVLDYLFDSSYSFVNAEGETVTIAINTASDVYHIFDATLSGVIISSATGEADPSAACENSLLLMIFVVAAALPPLAIIAIYFVVKVVWMMLRALFGYCQGMLGITFLVMLAPIYVSFALFRATRPMFDKWVQYLISFSFQMVIVFGFLGFMFNALSKTSESMEDYTALIRPLQGEQSLRPSVFTAIDTCGICEMEFQGTRNTPVCKTPERVLPLTSMISDTEFMKFASYKIFALVVLIMIFDMLLTFVPTMAAYLAGSKHAARLGGGEMNAGGAFQDNVAIPGSQALNEMANSAATEFARSGSTPGGIVNGFVGAFAGSDGGSRRGRLHDPFRRQSAGSVPHAAGIIFG
jgi:type IV secretory pathway VirB6-like protein